MWKWNNYNKYKYKYKFENRFQDIWLAGALLKYTDGEQLFKLGSNFWERTKKGDKLLPFLSLYRYPSIPWNTYQVVSRFCWSAYEIFAYKQGSGEYPPNGRPTPIMRSLSTETDQCGGVRYSHHKHSKILNILVETKGVPNWFSC